MLARGGQPFDVTYLNPSGAWAAGAIVSTARDVARFYQSLFSGRLLGPRMTRQLGTTVDETPGDPAAQSGLGVERYSDPCGVTWGHGGQILGYQSAAYWNQRTHRVVVLTTTLWPGVARAVAALIGHAYDYALCPRRSSAGPARRADASATMAARRLRSAWLRAPASEGSLVTTAGRTGT